MRDPQPSNYAKLVLVLFAISFITGCPVLAWSKGEVYNLNTSSTPAKHFSYTIASQAYQWGVGNDELITDVIYQGKTLSYNAIQPDIVKIWRHNNPIITGNVCTIYAEMGADPRLSILPSYPEAANGECNLESVIGDSRINIGTNNLFTNKFTDTYLVNNIERVDFIFFDGLSVTAENIDTAGHVLLEKGANSPTKIAAIRKLDNSGNPSEFGSLLTVYKAGYGNIDQLQYGVTSRTKKRAELSNYADQTDHLLKTYAESVETLGAVFVSANDLGIPPEEKYYGFSLFPMDVDTASFDLTKPETFPINTDFFVDDADLKAGTAGNFKLGSDITPNQTPIAGNDTAETTQGSSVTIDVLSNDSDPDGDPLSLSILAATLHGQVAIENNQIVYTPDAGYTGVDEFTYQITDGQGASATARVSITVNADQNTAVLAGGSSSTAVIETGLDGHGAGSFGWFAWLLPLIAVLRRRSILKH